MSERSIFDPQYARHRALIVLVLVTFIPVVFAEWFNGFRLFAFPFGTFLIALAVPIALIVVAFMAPRFDDEGPEEI